jgi:hypothetical protein
VTVENLGFTQAQLRNWKLIDHFRTVLLPALDKAPKHPSENDPRRQLTADAYFSLFLFRLFNPIITSMRGLCAASQFKKMRQISARPVAPSSFSEGQHLFNPEVLEKIVRDLARQCHCLPQFGDAQMRQAVKELTIIDGTVLRAVNRMAWAPAAGHGSSIKLHLHFSVFEQVPADWSITPGNVSEQKEWKKKIKADAFYVVDRLYGHDLLYLKQLQKRRVHFVSRQCENIKRAPQEAPRPLTEEDIKAGVISDRLEELGLFGGGPILRVVEIVVDGKRFILATTRLDLPAWMIALIYRYR